MVQMPAYYYVSKNTQKCDKKAFSEAARIMIKKLNEKMIQSQQHQNSGDNGLDQGDREQEGNIR